MGSRERLKLAQRLNTWADARERRNPFGHGKTGTQLLRDAAQAFLEVDGEIEQDAYELDDPKHPTFAERAADKADAERKREKEEGP